MNPTKQQVAKGWRRCHVGARTRSGHLWNRWTKELKLYDQPTGPVLAEACPWHGGDWDGGSWKRKVER